MFLLIVFAAAAICLSAVGLFGVLASLVAARTREIGIRITLGARNSSIMNLLVSQNMKMVLLGLGTGLLIALVAGRVLESQLFGIESTDPVIHSLTACILIMVALLAGIIPTLRALAINPAESLLKE